jgi:hypothetical protein
VNRSLSQFIWERLTRRGFGTGRTDLVVDVIEGVIVGLLLAVPLVWSAIVWRRQSGVVWPYFLSFLGAVLSLALLILSLGIVLGVRGDVRDVTYLLLGASASALTWFIVGCVLTEKRRLVEPRPIPDRPHE